MKMTFRACLVAMAIACLAALNGSTAHATISYVGSHYDMLDLFHGGDNAGHYVISPWRSDLNAKPLDIDQNNVYGSDGYALFATQFNWKNVSCCGSNPPVDSATYPNLIDTPSYVVDHKFLVTNKVGGWNYALVDDPTLVNGYRDYNWGDTLSPPADPAHSQSPYVKIGNIEGNDILGNNARSGPNGAGRWAFTLGADVPQTVRVSVMSDGYDGTNWSATEVLLAKVDDVGAILDVIGSGALTRNRFVDMHLFDIVGGQAGDNYAIFAKASGDGQGAIAGVAFDSVVPEPTGLTLLLAGIAAIAGLPKRNRVR